MLNNGRDYSLVSFYVNQEWQQTCPLYFPPRVGEYVEMWDNVRNENGGSVHILLLKGHVVDIKHIVEKSSQELVGHSWVQHTYVYMRGVVPVGEESK